ncbi:MAG: hypothetical protein JXR83_19715 [Deltaproteobacteria bacterium]|nr:hypothetical protein [Deltaproteobacteria bacterium]
MATVIDLWHIQRSRRLFRLLVDRFGVASFLCGGVEQAFRIDPARVADAVGLAAAWLELRTGRAPTEATLELMRSELRRLLIHDVAQHLVDTGY